jgi:hypothetical protein
MPSARHYPSEVERINQTWIATGNDLRAAIREYLNENPQILTHISLTPEEWKQLQDIPQSRSPSLGFRKI